MRGIWVDRWRVVAVLATFAPLLIALSVDETRVRAAAAFADPAFRAQWQTAEASIPNFWGPLSSANEGTQEPYKEAQGGQRLVQYFDKARMELTNPGSGVVTNGLLTVELISGRLQIADDIFIPFTAADIPVAGDADNRWPTYHALNSAIFPEMVARDTAPVGRVYNPDGSFSTDATLAANPGAAFGSYQNDPGGRFGHNIPAGMWQYLSGLPVSWLSVMGYPVTEPFWARVRVGGMTKPVLIQAYQRRVLTYTPGNPATFLVEMGNIGQHYYRWRYAAGAATATSVTVPGAPTTSGTAKPAASAPVTNPTAAPAATTGGAPAVPTNPRVTKNLDVNHGVRWTIIWDRRSTNEVGFHVYFHAGWQRTGEAGSTATNVTTLTIDPAKLQVGGALVCFQVTAYNDAGESSKSADACVADRPA